MTLNLKEMGEKNVLTFTLLHSNQNKHSPEFTLKVRAFKSRSFFKTTINSIMMKMN
jgi:hypothetical protein